MNTNNFPTKMPTKKTEEQIEFYIENTPKVFKILEDVAITASFGESKNPLDMKFQFETLCREAFPNNKISFPFEEVKNSFKDEFSHSICVSVNDCAAHGFDNFEAGDIVSVDVGLKIEDLNFDMATTTRICGAEPHSDNWARAPATALKRVLEEQPKDTMSISRIIEQVAEENNQSIIISLTGHGIGRHLHEAPYIYNKTGQFYSHKLFNGMVFCIEPVFVEGPCEKIIEDTYLDSDNWSVKTISGKSTSHIETMFCFWEDRIVDLTRSL